MRIVSKMPDQQQLRFEYEGPRFPKKGKKKRLVIANAESTDSAYFSIGFPDEFFLFAGLTILSGAQREHLEKMNHMDYNDIAFCLRDANSFFTHIDYRDGQLVRAEASTGTPLHLEINPELGFGFWQLLAQALREHPETAQSVRDQLERVASITSLDSYFERLRSQQGSLDEHFNRAYVLERGLKYYHPQSLDGKK